LVVFIWVDVFGFKFNLFIMAVQQKHYAKVCYGVGLLTFFYKKIRLFAILSQIGVFFGAFF
jgi:hypothetical protein